MTTQACCRSSTRYFVPFSTPLAFCVCGDSRWSSSGLGDGLGKDGSHRECLPSLREDGRPDLFSWWVDFKLHLG